MPNNNMGFSMRGNYLDLGITAARRTVAIAYRIEIMEIRFGSAEVDFLL